MNKNIVAFFIMVSIVLSTIIISVSHSDVARSKAIASMVDAGADPQAAACALEGVNNVNRQVCVNLVLPDVIVGPK